MKAIINVQHIYKKYQIGNQQTSYGSLRDSLISGLKNIGRKPKKTHIWALHDINFQLEQGDCLGIIGHNGAGKSTLLKVLSRITPPTKGSITLRGRLASLLEVGTGFHPELSGRENIYLNGAILNMKRREITSKFDEIVAFSGVEKFLDTPLKRYSSGMRLRLAFSVAAHLEPEILLIDEVLAVGDAEFQKKCIGKMDEVSKAGRTILFVSHNLSMVQQLCNKGMLLHNGKASPVSPITEAINLYQNQATNTNQKTLADKGILNILQAHVDLNSLKENNLLFNLNIQALQDHQTFYIDIAVTNQMDDFVLHFPMPQHFEAGIKAGYDPINIQYNIQQHHLINGLYTFTVYIYDKAGEVILWYENFCPFTINRIMTETYRNPLRTSTQAPFNIEIQ